MHTSIPTLITEALHRVTSLQLCYSEVTAYTALAYSYWAGFHDEYVCLRHVTSRPLRYQLQLPYKIHRTYLTNRNGVYITPHHATSY